MSGVTIYCFDCRTNHALTAYEAEIAIQTLVCEWADAVVDLEPHPTHEGEHADEIVYGWCVLDHLRWVDDPEAYGEHIEAAVESRRSAARGTGDTK